MIFVSYENPLSGGERRLPPSGVGLSRPQQPTPTPLQRRGFSCPAAPPPAAWTPGRKIPLSNIKGGRAVNGPGYLDPRISGTSPRTHPARVPTLARCPPSKGEYFHLSGHEDHLGRPCSIRLKTETVKEKVPTDQENLAHIGTFGCVRELIFSQGRQ